MPLKLLTDGQPVPFLEAIKAAEARQVVLPEIYYGELQGVARQLAFSITGVASLTQLQGVLDGLNRYLATGGTFQQWQKEASTQSLELPKSHLETIFRNHIQGQYQAGTWEQIERGSDGRDHLMYDAVNDSRTRPTHRALDGFTRPADDPVWKTIAPPNGHRCRCGLIRLTESQAKARSKNGNGLDKPYDPATMKPDPGWDFSPRERFEGINRAIAQKPAGALLTTLKQQLAQEMKVIKLDGFEQTQAAMATIAKQRPEWFPLGFNGLHAVSNPELFAAFDPKTARFYLSAADELIPGFNPAKEFKGALDGIARGETLTFNQEYAVETVWHEMMHGITGIAEKRLPLGVEPLAEGIVQLAARHSYHLMIEQIGGTAAQQVAIIRHGLAYPQVTANLLVLIGRDGYAVAQALMDGQPDWRAWMVSRLVDSTGLSSKNINGLLNQAERLSGKAFGEKVRAAISRLQSSKGA